MDIIQVSMNVYTSLQEVPPNNLEVVGCGICGGTGSKTLFQIRGFPIRQCAACQTRYVSPRLRPSSLLNLYFDSDYFNSRNSLVHGYMDYASDRENILATVEKRFQWISQNMEKKEAGRLLDIGCAMGFSLEYGMDRGWDVFGLEPSPYATRSASERLAGRIANTSFDACTYPKNSFDLVLLWDVIEHLPDPPHLLQQIFDLLRPGGTLSIITPDCRSLLARAAGRWWMEYAKPTEHIYFFSRKTLEALAQKTGLTFVKTTTAGKFVSRRFLFERFSAYLPLPSKLLKPVATHSFLSKRLYVDVGDKMHVVFRRPA